MLSVLFTERFSENLFFSGNIEFIRIATKYDIHMVNAKDRYGQFSKFKGEIRSLSALLGAVYRESFFNGARQPRRDSAQSMFNLPRPCPTYPVFSSCRTQPKRQIFSLLIQPLYRRYKKIDGKYIFAVTFRKGPGATGDRVKGLAVGDYQRIFVH